MAAFASLVLVFTLSATLDFRRRRGTDPELGGPLSSDAALVPLTLVRNAQARGAGKYVAVSLAILCLFSSFSPTVAAL